LIVLPLEMYVDVRAVLAREGEVRDGLVSAGEEANTRLPVPVWFEVISALPPPMEIDVALATPRSGVVNVGEVASTTAPLPVVPSDRSLADDGCPAVTRPWASVVTLVYVPGTPTV
jgi:hypothetical protein